MADHLVAHFIALHEYGCNAVFGELVVILVHHAVVQVGVEGLARLAEGGHTQGGKAVGELLERHLHAFFVALGVAVGGYRPFQIICYGQELRDRVRLAVRVERFLFFLGAFAEIIVFRQRAHQLIRSLAQLLFQRLDLIVLGGRFVLRFFRRGGRFVFCFLCGCFRCGRFLRGVFLLRFFGGFGRRFLLFLFRHAYPSFLLSASRLPVISPPTTSLTYFTSGTMWA